MGNLWIGFNTGVSAPVNSCIRPGHRSGHEGGYDNWWQCGGIVAIGIEANPNRTYTCT